MTEEPVLEEKCHIFSWTADISVFPFEDFLKIQVHHEVLLVQESNNKNHSRSYPRQPSAFCHVVKHLYGLTTILRKSCVYCNWKPKGLLRGKKSLLGISCFHASLASSPTPIPRHSASCLEVTQVTASRNCPEVLEVPEHAGVKFVKMITHAVAPRWQREHGFIELQKVKLEWSNLFSLACKALENETRWEEWCKSTLQIHVSFLLFLESQVKAM